MRLSSLILVLSAASASAQHTVNVPADKPTIQSAIDASATGDTVLVAPGTYDENLDLHGKAITLQSAQGAAVTILDGRNLAPTISFLTNETRATTVNGFTIRNGAPAPNSGVHGAGVTLQSASPTLLNNVFTGNLCAAVDATASAPLLQSNQITLTRLDASCLAQATAPIVLTGNPNDPTLVPTLLGNTIEHNDLTATTLQPNAGGVTLLAARAILQGNTIRFNTTPGEAPGAIQIYAEPTPAGTAPTLIEQNLIYGNTTACGAGGLALAILNDPTSTTAPHLEVQLLNNTVADNHSGATCTGAPGELTLSTGTLASQVILANNILAGSSASPALQCSMSMPAQSFHHNLLHNTQGLAFSSTCPDSGANHLANPCSSAGTLPPRTTTCTCSRPPWTPEPTASHPSRRRISTAHPASRTPPTSPPSSSTSAPTSTPPPRHPSHLNRAERDAGLVRSLPAHHPHRPGHGLGKHHPHRNHHLRHPDPDPRHRPGRRHRPRKLHHEHATRSLVRLPGHLSGSASVSPSTTSMLQTVRPATTVLAFSVTPSSADSAQSVTLSADAQAPLSTRAPTGQVQFFEIFPSPAAPTLITTTTLNTSGQTSTTLPTMSPGTHLILAAYPGTA